MRTTLTLDDNLLETAREITGLQERGEGPMPVPASAHFPSISTCAR